MPTSNTMPNFNSTNTSILERLFNSAHNTTNEKTSLVNLFDYIDYAIKNPSTKSVIDDLEKQRTMAYKTYYQLKSKALEELRASKTILLNIVNKNNLINGALYERMLSLKSFEEGKTIKSGDYGHNLYGYLFDICKNLLENKQQDLIKQFISNNQRPQNTYGDFVFSKSLFLFDKERDKIQHLKQIEMWHCWLTLKFIPEVSRMTFSEIMNLKVHLLEEENDYFLDFVRLREEVTGNKPLDYYKNDLTKYKDCLTRLHNYFIQKLSTNTNTAPLQQEVNHRLAFYPADGLAEYRSASYTFGAGTKGGELLRFLFSSKNTPLELNYFQDRCNQKIRIERHKFKKDKDIVDTINYIKKVLKVKKGEYFPLYKREKRFIWEEK